jgi:hypothetical protein
MTDTLQQAHEEARNRFLGDPSKCYQRHIREVWEALDGRHFPCIEECKKGCVHFPKSSREVRKITREEAASIILKYEWLAADPKNKAPLGRGIETCYGLFLNGELIGANCFGRMGGQIGNICGPLYAGKTGYLMRGACVHYAPMHAASFFTSLSCKLACKEMGWNIVFAYSDTAEASEVGTIYQACGWYYIGEDLGRTAGGHHCDYISPDGTRIITSYQLNHDKGRRVLRSLGWDGTDARPMRAWLRDTAGYKEIKRLGKKKWVTFIGPEAVRVELKKACRYKFLSYPKVRVPEHKKEINEQVGHV